MSDPLKHECGIALVRLRKPLAYYKEKYGTAFYGINKLYLLMEKQHNRGQDGAGIASVKLHMRPGESYIDRIRSCKSSPIQDVFSQVTQKINASYAPQSASDLNIEKQKRNTPFLGEVMLGHVRYGTYGKNSEDSVHPFIRKNNWMHRNLIMAGNFNMTNNSVLFQKLIELGQHPIENVDTVTVMEKVGHFLDAEVSHLYDVLKKEGFDKKQASWEIEKRLDIGSILKKAACDWDGGFAMAGLIGHGDAFVLRDPNGIRPTFYYQDDEVVVVTSERPVIQTAFNVPLEEVKELDPGQAIIIKKDTSVHFEQILKAGVKKPCSFERIYFSRGSDASIYQERKDLG